MWWIIPLTTVGGVLCAMLLFGRTAREPVYQGRPLHAWIEGIGQITFRITSTNGITLQQTNGAAAAVVATGDEAIPWLRRELRCQDPTLGTRLSRLALRLPKKF